MKFRDYKQEGLLIWLIKFIIWPLGTFISSLRIIGTRAFSYILVLFYSLFGYTYIIAGKDQDNYRIAQYFKAWSASTFDDLWYKIATLYELGNKPDLFQDILQFIVSRFTDNVEVYFAFISGLFALMVAKIFRSIYSNEGMERRSDFFLVGVSLFLLLIFSPGCINSFRHYFAVTIFLYALYKYLNGDGKWYLFLLSLTILIHFAFIMVLPLVALHRVIGNRFWVYYFLVFASFWVSDLAVDTLGEYTTTLDESSLQYHAKQYTSDVYLEKVSTIKENRSVILDKYIYITTLSFLIVTFYLVNKHNTLNEAERKLYGMSLLFFVFVNSFKGLESVSNRFGVMYQAFCCILIIRIFIKEKKFNVPYQIKLAFSFMLLFNAVIILRILAQSTSVSTVLVFFPITLLYPADVSILDWIK